MTFIPGETPVPTSSPVWGEPEKAAMCEQILHGWLTAGPKNKEFEEKLAKRWGTQYALTCNSGSSANLLAVGAMVESGRWHAGDEIITVAASFPTTINPLLQYGLVPVFTDVDLGTYNATLEGVKKALSPKTKGIMLAHTLGHPFPRQIAGFAVQHGLHLIEDCCDAFGAAWLSAGARYPVGSSGALSTCSFFPAHHIMTGEGGAVFTDDPELRRMVDSLASWGRDCYCDPGCENTCGTRFGHTGGTLPDGYDHKYIFSALGYNLKMTEVQAVCGIEQLKRLTGFKAARNENWKYLYNKLKPLKDHLILPAKSPIVEPSWFGFCITLRKPGERATLQEYLAACKIGSRLLFAGNIVRQPYMQGRNYRVSGSLANSDKVMEDSLWLGVWPGLTTPMLDYVCDKITGFFA
jgi:CDP-6-deoxy-D-xylo-4-hexulose-3-dehydrase